MGEHVRLPLCNRTLRWKKSLDLKSCADVMSPRSSPRMTCETYVSSGYRYSMGHWELLGVLVSHGQAKREEDRNLRLCACIVESLCAGLGRVSTSLTDRKSIFGALALLGLQRSKKKRKRFLSMAPPTRYLFSDDSSAAQPLAGGNLNETRGR